MARWKKRHLFAASAIAGIGVLVLIAIGNPRNSSRDTLGDARDGLTIGANARTA